MDLPVQGKRPAVGQRPAAGDPDRARRSAVGVAGGPWRAAAIAALLWAPPSACRGAEPETELDAAVDSLDAPFLPGAVALGNPLWHGLAAAVQDGDDALARMLVERLRAFAETDEERERLRNTERVLEGRELVRSLTLRLISEPRRERGAHRVVLLASHAHPQTLLLELPPARLSQSRTALDVAGGQTLELRTYQVEALTELELPPGRVTRLKLAESRILLEGALAVRERWLLRPLSGSIQIDGESYPASAIEVEGCTRVRLADELPLSPVPVEELVRYVTDENVRTAPLLERTVRVPSTAREEVLGALAPIVEDWSRSDPERVLAIAPALRWLTGTSHSSLLPREWAALLWSELDGGTRPRLDFSISSRGAARGAE